MRKYLSALSLLVCGAGLLGILWRQESPEADMPGATLSRQKSLSQTTQRPASSAAGHKPGMPRHRNTLGQALPFREAPVPSDLVAALMTAEPGGFLTLPLFEDTRFLIHINQRFQNSQGPAIAGQLQGVGERDVIFAFTANGEFRALVEMPSRNLAYEIAGTPEDGYLVQEWLFTDVICGTPLPGQGAAIGSPRPDRIQSMTTTSPIDPALVPILSSRPDAPAAIYLDFDGETVSGTPWANGDTIIAPSARLTAAQIIEVWERVTADFGGFNVNVTTDLGAFNAAPLNRRMRCIITGNNQLSPAAGGVAYLDTFRVPSEFVKICWAFLDSNPKDCAEVISHEIGHTLDLSHDGILASATEPANPYYEGHGSGPTGWAPIMGFSYERSLTQWSRGEYSRADNPEDDLAILSDPTRLPFRADDHASSATPAQAVTGSRIDGAIERNDDVDFFSLTLPAGTHTLSLQPSAQTNLDLELRVQTPAGTILASSNPIDQLSASATVTLGSPQTIHLRVAGSGKPTPLGTGYSNYSSLGSYRLTGFGDQKQIPSAPIGLQTLSISGSQIQITWVANPFADSYSVYRNGTFIGLTSETKFLDTNVQPSTDYSYSLVAQNPQGSSSPSVAAEVRSLPLEEYVMDGEPDFPGYLVSNPGMTIYAAVRGRRLYVATWSPGDHGMGSASDHHILISDVLLTSATTPAPWSKRGFIAVPGNKPYLAAENTSAYAGWFNTKGHAPLFKSPLNSRLLEGSIDLVAEFGAMPEHVYVTAVAYQTDDACSNTANGKINAQAPPGNGNDTLEPFEFLKIPVRSVRDSALNGTFDVLDAGRALRIDAITLNAQRQPTLKWPVVPGKTYRLHYRADLASGGWSPIGANRTAGVSEWEMTHEDTANAGSAGFYRLQRQ